MLHKPIFYDYYEIWILGANGSVVFLRTQTCIIKVDLRTEEAKRLCDGYDIEAFYL